jgi:cytochrome c oxidase subunit 3
MTSAPAALREPYDSLARQRTAAGFGMWVFLASEALFFGGMLMAYTMMRISHPHAFVEAGKEAEFWFGTANLVLLMTSSMTMSVAVGGARAGFARAATWCLFATALLGMAFLVVKGVEYHIDLDDDLWPGPHFKLGMTPAQLFWGFYWVMTFVHAVHLTIGIGLVLRLAVLARRGKIVLGEYPTVEVTGLYWHLIDIVWITLYPLLYLVGRS